MIVGTAGHIDHGKTSLVKAITGVDADRLKEEKARGITIDLGFAYWPQPEGGTIGFVDVPGHERFVHTMLAGAHGIDRVLLVVAADDGPMPQTREHLEVLGLLGLDRGAVALTKVDAVAPERAAAAAREVEALLDGPPLVGSPVFPLSNLTGAGIGALTDWVADEGRRVAARDAGRLFRLAVDRSFVLAGAGVVVTGMVLDGSVAVGDEVVVSPRGLRARVRGIHAQNRPAERGAAGQRCALNLAGPGIEKEAIRRGAMVEAPEAHAPTARIDVALTVAPGAAKGLIQWMPARFHHGSAEVGARIVLLGDRPPGHGEAARVQLVLEEPVAARALDRFVLRDTSGSRTLGGGRLLDLRAPERKRRTPERMALLDALAEPDPARALAGVLAAGPGTADLDAFARDRGLGPDAALAACATAGADPVRAVGRTHAVSRAGLAALAARIEAHLGGFHAGRPDELGIGRERLRLETAPRIPAGLFHALLRGLAAGGALVLDGNWVRLASHAVEISLEEENLWHEVAPRLAGADRFRPPRVRDVAKALQEDEEGLRRLMRRLARAGSVHEVAQDHFFLRATLAEAVDLAEAAESEAGGPFTAAAMRDGLEAAGGGVVGRKVAIQLLDFLDRLGVTVRRGDLRRLNPHRRDLFEAADPDGRESSPVGRPVFKTGWGREPVSGGFDSHSLPPSPSDRSGG